LVVISHKSPPRGVRGIAEVIAENGYDGQKRI
jgi:hypothetical protein